MNYQKIQENLSFVVYGDDAWRVGFRFCEGVLQIRLDVHGLTVADAKKMVSQVIAVTPYAAQICVVHGYHNGTGIRTMLRLERLSSRVYHLWTPGYNPGITWMCFYDRAGLCAVA